MKRKEKDKKNGKRKERIGKDEMKSDGKKQKTGIKTTGSCTWLGGWYFPIHMFIYLNSD